MGLIEQHDRRRRGALSRRLTAIVAPSVEEAEALRADLENTQRRLSETEAELAAERAEAERLRVALREAIQPAQASPASSGPALVPEQPPARPEFAEAMKLTERLQPLSDQELADSFASARDLYAGGRDQYWTGVCELIIIEASGRPAFSADGPPPRKRLGQFGKERARRLQELREAVHALHDVGSSRAS